MSDCPSIKVIVPAPQVAKVVAQDPNVVKIISGIAGTRGTPGLNFLTSPTNPPDPGFGVDGEWAIFCDTVPDPDVALIFGPKAGGVWPAGKSIIGADGADGAQGPQGDPGPAGADGADGLNFLTSPTNPPDPGFGVDGEWAIFCDTVPDPDVVLIFGPKAGGAWPAGKSLLGPEGPQGDPGNDGADGLNFLTSPTNPPDPGFGVDGEWAIFCDTVPDPDVVLIFGPKAGGAWPAGKSLLGPEGPVGPVFIDRIKVRPTDGATDLSTFVVPTPIGYAATVLVASGGDFTKINDNEIRAEFTGWFRFILNGLIFNVQPGTTGLFTTLAWQVFVAGIGVSDGGGISWHSGQTDGNIVAHVNFDVSIPVNDQDLIDLRVNRIGALPVPSFMLPSSFSAELVRII